MGEQKLCQDSIDAAPARSGVDILSPPGRLVICPHARSGFPMAINRRSSDRWHGGTGTLACATSPHAAHDSFCIRVSISPWSAFVAAGLPRHFRGSITPPSGEVNPPRRFGGAVRMSTRRHGRICPFNKPSASEPCPWWQVRIADRPPRPGGFEKLCIPPAPGCA